MLEDLSGIQDVRQITPENKPRWLDLVLDIEKGFRASEPKFYVKNDMPHSIESEIDRIPDICAKDVNDYIKLWPFLAETVNTSTDSESCMSLIATYMLKAAFKKTQRIDDVFVIDGKHINMDRWFNHVNFYRDTVFDNLCGDSISYGAKMDMGHILVFANCQAKEICNATYCRDGGTIVIANSTGKQLMNFTQGGSKMHTVIVTNSTFDQIHFNVRGEAQYFIAADCTERFEGNIKGERTSDYMLCAGYTKFPEGLKGRILDIVREMKGKDGMQVYKMAKEVQGILRGGR